MPRIIVISDTHGYHRDIDIPWGDVLIHCGDVTGHNYIEEVEDFNYWLGNLPHKYKIVIAGNHDGCLEKIGYEASSIYLSNAIYLENNGTTINIKDKKYKIWGSPITPTFMDWYFMADRGERIKKYWDNMPNNLDILITHGPAHGILDEVRPAWKRGHLGCEELTKAINIVKPKFHLFGHIHDGYSIKKNNNTLFVNASTCNEDYEPINSPVVIDI